MRTAQVIVVSALAHAPLLAYVAQLAAPGRSRTRPLAVAQPRQPPTPTPTPTHAEAATAPIEVVFLDEATDTRGDDEQVVTRHARPRATAELVARAAGVAAIATTPAGSGAESREPPGASTGLLRMRGPDLGLDPVAAERIAAAGGGEKPDELRRSGKLKPQPGGRAIVHDRVTTMTVDADGKAHFDDEKDIDPRFQLPIPKVWRVEEMRKDLGHELTEWFKDPEAGKRFGTTSELPRHLQAAPGACDAWGATMCDDPLAPEIEKRVRERKKVNGGFLGGPLDITAWLHRKFVGDPYSSRKLKLLADTLDERVAMGEAHRAQQSARSAEFMRKNLERLWADEQDPVARRAALFELWDECSDDEAGARARTVVIGWIRTYLPAGSSAAYTEDELATLQAHKTSRAPFAPYVER